MKKVDKVFTAKELAIRNETKRKNDIFCYAGKLLFKDLVKKKTKNMGFRNKRKYMRRMACDIVHKGLSLDVSTCFEVPRKSSYITRFFKNTNMVELVSLLKKEFKDIKPYYTIVAVDDDILSSMIASIIWHINKAKYGIEADIVGLGGKGMMSEIVFDGLSEAQKHAEVFCNLLVPEKCKSDKDILKNCIHILGEGENSGQNVIELDEFMESRSNREVLMVVTKRLGLRMKLTVEQQAKNYKADFYQIEEDTKYVPKRYNYKNLWEDRTLCEELSTIWTRCKEYELNYQTQIPDYIWDRIKENPIILGAVSYLEENFDLRKSRKVFKSLYSKSRYLIDHKITKELALEEESQVLEKVRKIIKSFMENE